LFLQWTVKGLFLKLADFWMNSMHGNQLHYCVNYCILALSACCVLMVPVFQWVVVETKGKNEEGIRKSYHNLGENFFDL
jgi:predicted transcriptional regulator YdeE